jgi:hypothetical protein
VVEPIPSETGRWEDDVYGPHIDMIAGALLDDDFSTVFSLLRDGILKEFFASLNGSMPGGSIDFEGNWMSFYGLEYDDVHVIVISVRPGMPFEGMFPVNGGGVRKTGVHYNGAAYMFIGNYENGLANGDFAIYKSYDDSPDNVLIITLEAVDGFASAEQPARIEAVDGGEMPDAEYPEKYSGIKLPIQWSGSSHEPLSEFWDL